MTDRERGRDKGGEREIRGNEGESTPGFYCLAIYELSIRKACIVRSAVEKNKNNSPVKHTIIAKHQVF